MPAAPSAQPSPRRGRVLSADEIVGVALRLARAEGPEAISMRRIGEELRASPMAVYRHVEDREDLLIRMLGVIADEVGPPVTDGQPRERVAAMMRSLHEVFRENPWIVRVLAVEGVSSPRILPVVEAMFQAFMDVGFDAHASRSAWGLLFQFLYGETLVSHLDQLSSFSRRMVEEADPAAFPHLKAAVESPRTHTPDYFETNLERLLDGLFGPTP